MDGYAAAHGMPDLRELPLGRLCSFIYWHLCKGADQQSIDKFRAKLWMPPAGQAPDARSPWAPENETKGFEALRAGLGITRDAATKRET